MSAFRTLSLRPLCPKAGRRTRPLSTSPSLLPEAWRAMVAMMKMKKIDLAAVKAAYDGKVPSEVGT